MKSSNTTPAAGRIAELRLRLEKLDAERAAVAVELHRLAEPGSVFPEAPLAKKDPIPGSAHKDWHVFAGPAKQQTPKPKT